MTEFWYMEIPSTGLSFRESGDLIIATEYIPYPYLYPAKIRLATYNGSSSSIVDYPLNEVDYIMVNSKNQFLQLVEDPTDVTGYPTFKFEPLTSGAKLTYFRLRDPRRPTENTFIIHKGGHNIYFIVSLTFLVGTSIVSFKCEAGIPCGEGYSCQTSGTELGNCYIPACQETGVLCRDKCSGICENGGECVPNIFGYWECSLDCNFKDCGGGCTGPCPNGKECQTHGVDSNGGPIYECREICYGECGGACEGTCPSGETCLKAADGVWGCYDNCKDKFCGGECMGPCIDSSLVCRETGIGVFGCVKTCEGRLCGGDCYGDCQAGICRDISEDPEKPVFECYNPCANGLCEKECRGTCPEGERCSRVNNEYQCVPACSGECGGECNGTCPKGETCLEDNDGIWSCSVPSEEEKVPVYKLWWFWLIIIGVILVIALIIFFLTRKTENL